jgi:hypothetical protein
MAKVLSDLRDIEFVLHEKCRKFFLAKAVLWICLKRHSVVSNDCELP